MLNFEEIQIKKRGLKATSPRKIILKKLIETKFSITPSMLEKTLSSQIDRVTLYRVLEVFHKVGIVHRFSDIEGNTRYTLCDLNPCGPDPSHDEHMHFKCLKCGQVKCLTHIKISNIELPTGYKLTQTTLNGEGYCKECN